MNRTRIKIANIHDVAHAARFKKQFIKSSLPREHAGTRADT
jgi:hypothetical protein